jgi:hypothetical protein
LGSASIERQPDVRQMLHVPICAAPQQFAHEKNASTRLALSYEAGFIQARNLSSSENVIRRLEGQSKLKV